MRPRGVKPRSGKGGEEEEEMRIRPDIVAFSCGINKTDTEDLKRFDTKRADAAAKATEPVKDEKPQGKTSPSIETHAATALRTPGIAFFRINLSPGPRSVIGTDCHPVTSGMSARLSC